MVRLPRLSHPRHTGRLRPHGETSYAALMFVMLILGVALVGMSSGSNAATTGGGTYDVLAVVAGPKPTSPATITSPSNGQSFATNPVEVDGTCPAKSLVKVFSNGILVGSALCGSDGRFKLEISLVVGANVLTALPFNTNEESGPVSGGINVTLQQPAGGPGFSTELLLQSTSYYRGAQPGQEIVWPITIVGGTAPYAVNFDWGDGTSDLVTRTSAGPFTLSHTYKKPGGYLGSYPLIIRATDSAGRTAFLQLTTIVNSPTGNASTSKLPPSKFDFAVLWPLWIILVAMIASFWLGERREKKVLLKKLALA